MKIVGRGRGEERMKICSLGEDLDRVRVEGFGVGIWEFRLVDVGGRVEILGLMRGCGMGLRLRV